MKIVKYLTIFVVLTTVGILYEKYKNKYDRIDIENKYDLVQNYLLNNTVDIDKKPILWIHTKYEINSRKWLQFMSKNSRDLNQPYIEECMESVLLYCSKSFKICLINDESFKKLLPDCTIIMDKLASPIRDNIRQLALMKLLHKYGGMLIPNSTLVFKDLKDLYNKNISKGCFVGEMRNINDTANLTQFFPSHKFIGCVRENDTMQKIINYLEQTVSRDFTSEMNFKGKFDRFLFKMLNEGKMNLVCGSLIGTKTEDDKVITIDDILTTVHVNINKHIYCMILPEEQFQIRTKYKWIMNLNKDELLNSNTNLSKYITISKKKLIFDNNIK